MSLVNKYFGSYLYKYRYSNNENMISFFYLKCTIEPTYESMDILLGIARLIINKYYDGESNQGEMKVVSRYKIEDIKDEPIYILEYSLPNRPEEKDDEISFEKTDEMVSSHIATDKLLDACRDLQYDKGCPFITDDEIIQLLKKFELKERKIN